MQLSEEDKQRTLQQLADMFSDTPRLKIESVCKQYGWKLGDCIDYLISASKADENTVPANSDFLPATWSSVGFQFQNGAIPKADVNVALSKPSPNAAKNRTRRLTSNSVDSKSNTSTEQRISELISSGFRVMVLMRGASGSGKSTLARNLVEQHVPLAADYSWQDFVLSTDDWFVDAKGRYRYSSERLSEVHARNHRRVLEKAAGGWSPIIIDNTNIQLWEMLPYVQSAMLHGYIIEILEPMTPWRNSAGKLALKTRHGVPRDKIQGMLEKYEKGSVGDLIKMIKNTKCTVPLPQMRRHPPVVLPTQQDVETEERFQMFNSASAREVSAANESCDPAPKEQRTNNLNKSRSKEVLMQKPAVVGDNEGMEFLQQTTAPSWRPHEEEIFNFWGQDSIDKVTITPSSASSTTRAEKTLLDLLKEGMTNGIPESIATSIDAKSQAVAKPIQHSIFENHRPNCPNENESFAELRQIYPNKKVTGLWDLFVKCNGDIDWAVDILLKEDELSIDKSDDLNANSALEEKEGSLKCYCDISSWDRSKLKSSLSASPPPVSGTASQFTEGAKLQRLRTRAPRQNQRSNNNTPIVGVKVKDTLESLFVLGPEHYSEHVRKIRDIRSGVAQAYNFTKTGTDIETQTDAIEEDEVENEEDQGLLEVTLEQSLVQQLGNIFKSDTTSLTDDTAEAKSPLKVFMSRTLAKELYMLCIESTYNQLEEQRQQTLREDEEFARLLKIPKYENYKESPNNMSELLDMELAWAIYNNEKELQPTRVQDQQPADLASHLSHLKLCEVFPDIPRETLLDILAANGNRYGETVEALRSTMNDGSSFNALTQVNLLERAICENEKLSQQVELKADQQQLELQGACFDSIGESGNFGSAKANLQPEEAKRLSLRDFEETRNLAAHHCQLKAECYQKAKEAIQKGNSGVAVYYSQIANLHKKKIDMYNHRAANCIMQVHKYTQNNPDLLDLHYLHALEAIGCLDLFLDRHITGLRCTSRSYKHVFIITGRGLHSIGGVSTIKNKVKSRLKERNLRWSEVNPGLLKVKIFSASRHSKNIV